VLTGDIVLVPELFGRVLAPQAVRDELANREAPAALRAWIAQAPAWLDVQPDPDAGTSDDLTVPKLDRGERAVIALARAVSADGRSGRRDGCAPARLGRNRHAGRAGSRGPGAGWSTLPRRSSG
jgi:predicted nucleic acid-binding protein